jgi:hypothetical protein
MPEIQENVRESAAGGPGGKCSRRPSDFQISLGLLAAIPLVVLFGYLTGFIGVERVSARGSAQITSRGAPLQVAFASAQSDDPPGSPDPAQELDVGSCLVGIRRDGNLTIAVLNGYPGYTCSLQVTLHNRGRQTASLQEIQYDSSPGISLEGPLHPRGLVLYPDQKAQQTFTLRVTPEAGQSEAYDFAIWEVFEPAP